MADNLFAFDEASAKKIIEQIRFLETRVRNLQTQIGQFRSYGVVRHGDRGVSQDTIILVRLKDNERLHNADLSKVPQRERETGLTYRTNSYSISALADVVGFNRQSGVHKRSDEDKYTTHAAIGEQEVRTGMKNVVRIFDPTGTVDLRQGDMTHVFWNRHSDHWEVLASSSSVSTTSMMMPMVLKEDMTDFEFLGSETSQRQPVPKKLAEVKIVKLDDAVGRFLSEGQSIANPEEENPEGPVTPEELGQEEEEEDIYRHFVIDWAGLIPWAMKDSKGYGIQIPLDAAPSENTENAETGIFSPEGDDVRNELPTNAKIYFPVSFEQRMWWFGFIAEEEIHETDTQFTVSMSQILAPGSVRSPFPPHRHGGRSPAPFHLPPNEGGDTITVINTFGFTVDKAGFGTAMLHGADWVLIQARCPEETDESGIGQAPLVT